MSFLKTSIALLRETRRDFFHTGTIMPSSRFLGRALAAPLNGSRPPARILEVGPGTGAVTTFILQRLQPEDRLDIVEINENFVRLLERRLETEPLFQRHRHQIQLMHAPVEEVADDVKYDFIISGLPLTNFPASLVRHIFRVFRRLLAPGGTLSFFEYVALRRLKTPFVGSSERRRLSAVGRVLASYVRKNQIRRITVFANVPPAYARHFRFAPKG